MTSVRVGIVSWNTAALLDRCLEALPAALESVDFDTVVVDNASSDNSLDVARGHDNVTVIANTENQGYARAMNTALTTPSGDPPDVLIALNPDTVPTPGSLASLVHSLRTDPSVGLASPRLVYEDGSSQHSAHRFPSPVTTAVICLVPERWQRGPIARRWWLEGRVSHEQTTDVDWVIGAVHVIRAQALEGAAPYDERWFMYVEDLDLCWRLQQKGWRIRLSGDATVMHVANAAGAQAWGDARTERWWGATYDWYRLRRGTSAARRWARVNAVGVSFLLLRTRLRRRLLPSREAQLTPRVDELRTQRALHRTMLQSAETAFLPTGPASAP